MSTAYRPIKPALSKDGNFGKEPQDRAASKRNGIIKSACLECRKRKSKCNGLKPTCANCAKWGVECIYDSDVRDAKLRNLQSINESLEAELEAAKTLLIQVASGPDRIRSIVLELLQNAKEPLEILEVLSDAGGIDVTMEDSQVPGETTIPPLSTEGVLHHAESFAVSNSGLAENGFEYSSMTQATFYQSHPDTTTNIPVYPISQVKDGSPGLQQPQNLQSQAQATIPMRSKIEGSPDSIQLENNPSTISRQPGKQSLFFEPLFNHDDFLLTTATDAPGRSPHNSQHGTVNHINEQSPLMYEGPTRSMQTATTGIDSYISPQSNLEANSEQALSSSLDIQPNFRNHFNNLSLSSSIRANGYPGSIQDAQIRNIFVPDWAATSLNTIPDPGHLDDAFGDIYKRGTSLLQSGEPVHRIAGHHPNVAALYDQQEFDRSCLLSQWAARMVHSVKHQGYDFTCFASMNVFWYMMRWMIDPTPESYAAMPEWIRPTSHQLFTPHISMADFVLWPGFRDLVVQLPQLQQRMEWLADMSLFIKCDWPYTLEQALYRNPVSERVDLTDLAKQHVWTLGCWSVGPSFRRFLPNADSYLLVRPEEQPV
ncbi:hypothetical protein FPOAC2_06401 [Fusarium poae]|uniref:hypothetical protein n=1 Tax=Fusarium poae TaxID=36050 RepID=UPI001CEBCC6F|nr:hypothetical protein FPOAC1_006281 [Fusarium poae]KAG8672979.1 hypothetical protein FPOAC1_006281 [Fusarium poae]